MEARILTMEQIPEALSIARGVFDCCLRAQISDLEMVHIFLQYTEEQNIKKMVEEQKLTLWAAYDEQNNMVAVSGMQSEGHITLLYVLPYFQRRGYGKKLLLTMREYARGTLELAQVTVNAMPAWTASYFAKNKFKAVQNPQPVPYVFMHAKSVESTEYPKKEIPTAAILATSLGGLAICTAIAVVFIMQLL